MTFIAALSTKHKKTQSHIDGIVFFKRFQGFFSSNIISVQLVKKKTFAQSIKAVFDCKRSRFSSVGNKSVAYFFW